MKRSRLFIIPVALCSFVSLSSRAQSTEAIGRYSETYMRAVGDNAVLFVGKIQDPMPGNIESLYLRDKGYVELDSAGHEVFPKAVAPLESYGMGDIFYDGVLYVGVRMRLDLYRDELMVAAPNSSVHSAILFPERLGYADLRGYRIIPSPSDDLPGTYYLQLHDGANKVLKKERFEFNRSRMEFSARFIRYYIEKGGVYHNVGRRKGAVLRAFGDRRDELRRFIRDNGINLRNNTETALVEITKEYERLTTDRP